jgi:NADH dehydrogenase FAD-containing subunit
LPEVVVCGAGAAGTELAFAFKQRWSDLFKKDIKVTLVANDDTILKGVHESVLI